eukprot:TRINITY_DN4148_c0_g1_i4.p1 TRINITY_DN4148_c0_g1~~TRINITY_DN4148_c0_g1_i4.p1  ORF type:complete len:255 (-),score=45.94 TRINITY_DN4148_c0_g1_i4:148-912(-)
MSSGNKTPLPFYVNFLAGGIAGVTEICVTYPLDVVKTRFQLKVGENKASIFSTMAEIVKNEGFSRLYRGIVPPILMEAPKRAVKFAANDFYSGIFSAKDAKTGKLVQSQASAVAAGVSAGCTEAVVIVPFELIKIRLQAKENAGLYKNTIDCLVKVVRTEGLRSLYTGLEATIWRHAFWNGGYFGIIFQLKKTLPQAQSKEGETLRNFYSWGPWWNLWYNVEHAIRCGEEQSAKPKGLRTPEIWLALGCNGHHS